MDYDPNILRGMTKQKVKLTFASWTYRYETEIEVGSNCSGVDVLEAALDFFYDRLVAERDKDDDTAPVELTMTNPEGDEMLVEDDDEDGVDWLKAMLIKFEIVSVGPLAGEN